MSENGEIYIAGKKNYTATGSDGSDKSHLWIHSPYSAGKVLKFILIGCINAVALIYHIYG